MDLKQFTLAMFCVGWMGVQAQAPCTLPVSNAFLLQRIQQISAMPDQARRLNMMRNFTTNQCVTSAQLKQLLVLLIDDQDKYNVSIAVWPRVTDQANFYDVYDGFGSLSMVMRLHDFVQEQRKGSIVVSPTPPLTTPPPPVLPPPAPPAPVLSFPNLPYPNVVDYLGHTMCMEPMTQMAFDETAQAIFKLSGDANRMSALRNQVVGKCASVGQIMRLATLVQSETQRLDFVRSMYNTTFDVDQFDQCQYLFSLNNVRQEFTRFLNGQPGGVNSPNPPPAPPAAPVCSVSTQEFADITASLKKVSFDSSRLIQARSIVQAKKCFTVNQITDLCRLFSFDNSRLDLAKFAYEFCTNPSDYFKVNEVFTFDASKTDLTRFINSKR